MKQKRSTLGPKRDGLTASNAYFQGVGEVYRDVCRKCGARRIDSQLGLESTIEEYVANIVEVFRAVRRVLKCDGTLWLNLGDSYHNGDKGGHPRSTTGKQTTNRGTVHGLTVNRLWQGGLKPKDLCMIPARVALALQADGWYLRSEIVWHKTNPMPESCKDRPTKSHEMLYLFSKSARYHCDMVAIREPASADTHARYARGRGNNHKWADGGPGNQTIATNRPGSLFAPGVNPKAAMNAKGSRQNASFSAAVKDIVGYRNKRSVWTIATKPFKGAHFATFPPKLIEPCILAGSRKDDVVLDPFNGAGTTGLVATEHGRRYLGIELNPEYVAMTLERLRPTITVKAASA